MKHDRPRAFDPRTGNIITADIFTEGYRVPEGRNLLLIAASTLSPTGIPDQLHTIQISRPGSLPVFLAVSGGDIPVSITGERRIPGGFLIQANTIPARFVAWELDGPL